MSFSCYERGTMVAARTQVSPGHTVASVDAAMEKGMERMQWQGMKTADGCRKASISVSARVSSRQNLGEHSSCNEAL